MNLEPVLLKASLGAIFYIIAHTFWTSIIWNELLIKLFVLFDISGWIIYAVLLVFPHMLQWALVILALAHMYHLFIWRMWCFYTDAHCSNIHHC